MNVNKTNENEEFITTMKEFLQLKSGMNCYFFMCYFHCVDKNNFVALTHEKMSEIFKCSRPTVKDVLTTLENNGFIKKHNYGLYELLK